MRSVDPGPDVPKQGMSGTASVQESQSYKSSLGREYDVARIRPKLLAIRFAFPEIKNDTRMNAGDAIAGKRFHRSKDGG